MVPSSMPAQLSGDPYRADCPTRRILDRIGDRWTVLVVLALVDGDARFSELHRRIEGVSKKMLTQTLRALERDGLLRRTVHAEVPVRVDYGLTDAGRTLCEPLRALERWSVTHVADVSTAQTEYDGAHRPAAPARRDGVAGGASSGERRGPHRS